MKVKTDCKKCREQIYKEAEEKYLKNEYRFFADGRVDALATAKRCIEAFERDHNSEHLVDAANYLMFRYKYPIPGDYFKATDSAGSVGTVGIPVNMEKEF